MTKAKKKILIIEDDQEINKLLQVMMAKMGVDVISAYSGSEGILQSEQEEFDLVLLDLMLPGIDGKGVLEEVRKQADTPVIVISAKEDIETKIDMLRLGADDYITKPFNQEEVIARIEVQLRKSNSQSHKHIKVWRGITVDTEKLESKLDGELLKLTNAEFDILSFLIDNPERALSKKEIYEKVWRGTYVGDDNTISVHISNLRKKIALVTNEEYIQTVWGIGFMLV